ncbi:MAG: YqgE/AlgH family protein [Verrucomicrobiota bacterium]
MEFDNPDQLSLTGKLLLADPSLRDPNFKKAVLLLCHHTSEEGAQGYILNRPLGKTVSELTDMEDFSELGTVPVFLGGPVGTDQLTFASMAWQPDRDELDFEKHLSAREACARIKEGFVVKAFVGHSGWSAGQLEGEIMERSWISHVPDERVLTAQEVEMWNGTLSSMSPWHYLLSKTPDDPSLN